MRLTEREVVQLVVSHVEFRQTPRLRENPKRNLVDLVVLQVYGLKRRMKTFFFTICDTVRFISVWHNLTTQVIMAQLVSMLGWCTRGHEVMSLNPTQDIQNLSFASAFVYFHKHIIEVQYT